MSTSTKVFEALEKFEFLHSLPVVLLQIVATYACIGPIQGRLVAKFGTKGYGRRLFSSPRAIALSEATRELLVLDDGTNRVQIFSLTDMSFVREFGHGHLKRPRDICIDKKTGHVFVTDPSKNSILEFQLDGTFIRSIDSGPLTNPRCLSVDSEARLIYVTECKRFDVHRVSVISLEDGSFVRSFGTEGSGDDQFSCPVGIHFDEERKLLLISDLRNHRVKLVNPDGSLVRTFDLDSTSLPWDVTVNSNGEVLIADRDDDRIEVFYMTTGQHTRRFGNSGNSALHRATGICWDPNTGRLFVTERGTQCVAIYE